MASIKIKFHEEGLTDLVNKNKYIRDELVGIAQKVAAEAKATADSAQRGSGGTISGYAEAGFSVQYQSRGGKRPRVNIVSNADPETFMKAYWYTQKRDGVSHLRAALYKFTRRG